MHSYIGLLWEALPQCTDEQIKRKANKLDYTYEHHLTSYNYRKKHWKARLVNTGCQIFHNHDVTNSLHKKISCSVLLYSLFIIQVVYECIFVQKILGYS